ncbi:cytokine receptor family member b1 [Polymixia lowei]
MKYFLLTLYLTIPFSSAQTSLPAPANLTMESRNFHYVLHWDPGPGTPPGTQYKIFRRCKNITKQLKNHSNTTTRYKLKKLNIESECRFHVQASYNQSQSRESNVIAFLPFRDTVIGPPELSLAGCGNCIEVNISLPETGSNVTKILKFYGASFKIFWKKTGESLVSSSPASSSESIVNNLEAGVEYCVQVHIMINTNTNTEPSDWTCVFTSKLEPRRVPVVLGTMAVLLIIGGLVLISIIMSLVYAGFLCKLKAPHPRVLLDAWPGGYVLTPESTFPDLVSISTGPENNICTAKLPRPEGPNPEDEDDEDDDDEADEEEGENDYMDRAAGLSSGASSCWDSHNASGASVPATSGDSSSFNVRPWSHVKEESEDEVEKEAVGGHHQLGLMDERAEVSFMPDWDRPEILVGMEGEKEREEESGESSANVNLFSVTLGSLEDEADVDQTTLVDFLKPSDQHPLPSADLQRTLSSDESQSGTQYHGQPLLALMQPAQERCAEAEYQGRHVDNTDRLSGYLVTRAGETQSKETEEEEDEEEDEDEDEEEFGGYMGRH